MKRITVKFTTPYGGKSANVRRIVNEGDIASDIARWVIDAAISQYLKRWSLIVEPSHLICTGIRDDDTGRGLI